MTTETTPSIEEQIASAVSGIEPGPPDPGPALALAAQTRQQIAAGIEDRSSVYYRRPDLLEAHDRDVAVLLARHGLRAPPVEAPSQQAAREHAEAFNYTDPPGFQKMIEDRVAAIEARGTREIAEATAALREQLGGAEYDRLADLARPAGAEIPRAVFADEHLLRCAAADGAFARARERTRPR